MIDDVGSDVVLERAAHRACPGHHAAVVRLSRVIEDENLEDCPRAGFRRSQVEACLDKHRAPSE